MRKRMEVIILGKISNDVSQAYFFTTFHGPPSFLFSSFRLPLYIWSYAILDSYRTPRSVILYVYNCYQIVASVSFDYIYLLRLNG